MTAITPDVVALTLLAAGTAPALAQRDTAGARKDDEMMESDGNRGGYAPRPGTPLIDGMIKGGMTKGGKDGRTP